ncbi:HISTONE H1 [Salix koriyanagi]|uniref:HISTONE H1 n=1 Tax=Salix koriyanagi TaxID=2511006 RepID=A0A9Q0P730_9ROSI|nr:HISTONE H1 [Salix koriyanagi]
MSGTTNPKKSRSPRAYPSFHEMICDAIMTLKERSGSSQYAITKFLEDKHKKHLPANFRKLLLVQLKKLVASAKLVKVKNSFKLPSAPPKRQPQISAEKTSKPKLKTKTPSAKPKSKLAAKPKVKTPVKAKTGAKPKKAVTKPAKVASTKKVASPGKKAVAKPAKVARTKKVASPGKKAVAAKPRSVKSPTVKKGVAKKAKK